MRIKDMQPRDKGRVVAFTKGSAEYRQRLFMLGIVPGTEFELLRVAPFGDPVELRVRGGLVSLRKDEASVMEVEQK